MTGEAVPVFPRVGSMSAVFDAVTVTFRDGAYVATARRDGIRATRSTAWDPTGRVTPSDQAVRAAWRARLVMVERWRTRGHEIDDENAHGGTVSDLSDQTAAEWADASRYAAVVVSEVPGHAYVVAFIPLDVLARGGVR